MERRGAEAELRLRRSEIVLAGVRRRLAAVSREQSRLLRTLD